MFEFKLNRSASAGQLLVVSWIGSGSGSGRGNVCGGEIGEVDNLDRVISVIDKHLLLLAMCSDG